jgi:hypothetical protein
MQSQNPASKLLENESLHSFLCFCTYITLLYGKKLNLANIFLLCLKHSHYKNFLKTLLDVDNDYSVFKMFFEFDSTLYKSKYIMKYINRGKNAD